MKRPDSDPANWTFTVTPYLFTGGGGGGTGDITGVFTSATSGLSGGVASGDANLALAFASLSDGTSRDATDILAVEKPGQGMRRYTLGDVETYLETSLSLTVSRRVGLFPNAGEFLTTDGTNNNWRLITATDLAASPNNNELLSWDGSALDVGVSRHRHRRYNGSQHRWQ